MITVRIFNSKGEKVSEKAFESASSIAAYYKRMEDPDAPEKPSDGCWNCKLYDPAWGACMKEWNNFDSVYYIPVRDNKEPDDYCDEWKELI